MYNMTDILGLKPVYYCWKFQSLWQICIKVEGGERFAEAVPLSLHAYGNGVLRWIFWGVQQLFDGSLEAYSAFGLAASPFSSVLGLP